MSLYTEWLNKIKTKANNSWLTRSQKEAYNILSNRWFNHPFINLSGPPGCGKSFIARLLVKEHHYIYTHSLKDAPDGSNNVIVDDAVYKRFMRHIATEKQLSRIILITQLPIKEAMPVYELSLLESDVKQFAKVLETQCQIYFNYTVPEGNDLERIILNEIQKRGEKNHEH